MSTMTPCDPASPLMLAWKAYLGSPEYANTARWAVRAEHTEGSLWAAFEQGWRASERRLESVRAGEEVS